MCVYIMMIHVVICNTDAHKFISNVCFVYKLLEMVHYKGG